MLAFSVVTDRGEPFPIIRLTVGWRVSDPVVESSLLLLLLLQCKESRAMGLGSGNELKLELGAARL